jgi:hypothetical protein
MPIRTSIARAALVALCVAATARGEGLQASLSYWEMRPEGTASVGSDGLAGTIFDIEDDLGYGSSETLVGIEGRVGGTHALVASYLSLSTDARSRISRQIQFGDITYAASANVSSSLDADLLRLAYRYEASTTEVRLGVLAGAQLVSFDAALSASGFGTASEQADTGLPVIGIELLFEPLPFIRLETAITGGAWDWDSTSAAFWDGHAQASLFVYPFFIGVGYRYISLDADENSIPLEIDLTFRGPQVVAGVSF